MGAGASAAVMRAGGGMPIQLKLAIAEGDLTSVKLSMDHITVRCERGWTPLMWASWMGHENVVEWLVKQERVSVDATAQPGLITPLLLASWGGHIGIVKILLNQNADVTLGRDPSGNNVLTAALHAGRWMAITCEYCQRSHFTGALYRCAGPCKSAEHKRHFDMCEDCFFYQGHPPQNPDYFLAHDVWRYGRPGDLHPRYIKAFSEDVDDRTEAQAIQDLALDIDSGKKNKLVKMSSMASFVSDTVDGAMSQTHDLKDLDKQKPDEEEYTASFSKRRTQMYKENAADKEIELASPTSSSIASPTASRRSLGTSGGGAGSSRRSLGTAPSSSSRNIIPTQSEDEGSAVDDTSVRRAQKQQTLRVRRASGSLSSFSMARPEGSRVSALSAGGSSEALGKEVSFRGGGGGSSEALSPAGGAASPDTPLELPAPGGGVTSAERIVGLEGEEGEGEGEGEPDIYANDDGGEEAPGYFELAKLFLSMGVNNNVTVRFGMYRITPPLLALGWRESSLALLDALENYGCLVDAPLQKPYSNMVDVAVKYGKFAELQWLGERGHDISNLTDDVFGKLRISDWYRADA